MSSNRRTIDCNANDGDMPQNNQALLFDEDFDDEGEEYLFFNEEGFDEIGAYEEYEEEFSDAEHQLHLLDYVTLPMYEPHANGEQAPLCNVDAIAGPSVVPLPTPLVDVDPLAVVQANDGQHEDFGGVNSAQKGEVDPGALNDDEWLRHVRIGDRAHAVVEGRGRGRPRGVRGVRACGQTRGLGRGRRGVIGKVAWVRGDEWFNVCPTNDDLLPEERERFAQQVQVGRVEEPRGNWMDVEDEAGPSVNVMEDYDRFCADENASRFEWEPMNTFQGVKEQFLVDRTGPSHIFITGYEAFRAIWDAATVGVIVNQTNAYAAALSNINREFLAHWYDTNEHEILVLMAFWMLLGIIQMPSINACFSGDPYLQTSVFRNMFTKRRYWMLNKALRFAPNQTLAENPDKLHHIRPIVEMLNEKFKELYTPAQDICIDESLTLWKGNVSFRPYIKTKASKYSLKMFELCESSTGYLWSFFVYTGTETEAEACPLNKPVQTVLRLVRPLLKKGYRLFMDNWFNSPLLARFLKRNKTDCVGTLRLNRKHIPPIVAGVMLRQGSYIALHAGDVMVLSLHDRKPLVVISTHHGTEQIRTAARDGHPSEHRFTAVADYNACMGGLDRNDQVLESYLIERQRCTYWFKKLFKRLLNVSVINSRILVEQSVLEDNSRPLPQLRFRLEIVKHLFTIHGGWVPVCRIRAPPAVGADPFSLPGRLLGSPERLHYPKRMETEGGRTDGASRNSKSRLRCVWCTKREHKESKTVYKCSVCKVPLCLEKECFLKFHTVQ